MTCAAIDESVLSLAVLNADGWGLELTFWIEADRCAHRLAAIDGTRRVVLLESIEGAADDLWPPSPPWQQVNAPFAARLSSGNLSSGNHAVTSAMLVGAAGASHWSASVEGVGVEGIGLNVTHTEENQNQSSTGWLFDVACRAKRPPERLISTYRIVDPSQIVTAASDSDSSASDPSGLGPHSLGEGRLGGGLLELQTDIGRYQLRGLPLGSTHSDSCQLCVSDQRVELSVPMAQALPAPAPTTYRWRYRISTT